jgi:hypothetical protein
LISEDQAEEAKEEKIRKGERYAFNQDATASKTDITLRS